MKNSEIKENSVHNIQKPKFLFKKKRLTKKVTTLTKTITETKLNTKYIHKSLCVHVHTFLYVRHVFSSCKKTLRSLTVSGL